MLSYYRGRWPDDPVPPDSPIWLHYEVDLDRDSVLRSVELYADGRGEGNSITLEERDGFPCNSIWGCSFFRSIDGAKLEIISADEFEALWVKSVDTPPPPAPKRLYHAIIFESDGKIPGRRVSVFSESPNHAKLELETKYGEGKVFDLHNKEDVASPRSVSHFQCS